MSSDNNFLPLGAGLESLDLSNGSEAEGLRLSAEGRFGVPGPFFFYGRYALAPDMGDAGSFGDISSSELDLGIHITTFPFMSLRIGYLQYELDYDGSGIDAGGKSEASGFYLGGGFHW